MKNIRTGFFVALLAVVICSAAFASLTWFKTFNTTYKPKAGSALAKAKCAVCHVSPNGKGDLNAYGKMLKGKKVDAASLKAIENKDADKDKVSNIKEIKAGKLPGDPKSK